MGASDSAKQGYPKSLQKKDWTLYRYCGGGGAGGGCPYVQNKTQIKFAIEVNPYLVKNNSITLRNPEFFGIVLYPDAGVSGFCDHSYVLGTEVDWYLGFSNDGVLTDQEVRDQNLLQTAGAPPFDIEVSGNKLPQPTDSDWSGIMYVHIHWTDSLYVSDQGYVDDIQYLRVVQHNYQVRQ